MTNTDPVTTIKYDSSNRTFDQQDFESNRETLDEQLDWLTVDHDDLRKHVYEQITAPKYHPAMTLIDIWEEETIASIRHTAFLARRTLIEALDNHALDIKNKLDMLTPELREACHNIKPFNHEDIQRWANILKELKKIPEFSVIPDKENYIYGLTIDLNKPCQTLHIESNRKESTSYDSVSINSDPIYSIMMSDGIKSPTKSSNLKQNNHIKSKKVQFEDLSVTRSENITPTTTSTIQEK